MKKGFVFAGYFSLICSIILFIFNGYDFGILAFLGLSVVLIFSLRLSRNVFRILFGGLALAAGFMCFLFFFGLNDTVTYDEDVIIVLGAGIRGETPTKALVYRLNKALEYHERNPKALIVVSGGQGPREDISEALAMERYLVERGVTSSNIIKEDKSTSTQENFLFSKRILDNHFDREYTTSYVTNDFHIFRASIYAKIAGLSPNRLHASTPWYLVPPSYFRECAAVIKLLIVLAKG